MPLMVVGGLGALEADVLGLDNYKQGYLETATLFGGVDRAGPRGHLVQALGLTTGDHAPSCHRVRGLVQAGSLTPAVGGGAAPDLPVWARQAEPRPCVSWGQSGAEGAAREGPQQAAEPLVCCGPSSDMHVWAGMYVPGAMERVATTFTWLHQAGPVRSHPCSAWPAAACAMVLAAHPQACTHAPERRRESYPADLHRLQ